MKKVEILHGIDGVNRTWQEIEKLYCSDLVTKGTKYISPLSRLQKLKSEPDFQNPSLQAMLTYLIRSFKPIIKAKPADLCKIIKSFRTKNWQSLLFQPETSKLNSVGKKLLDAFSYERLRSTKLTNLASILNIKSCLYCNSQYTLTVRPNSKTKTKFQYDHFFPKKTYPYLSISLYNLIPSCASCNQSKSERNYSLSELVHPYIEDFHNLTQFQINDEAHVKLLLNEKIPESKIKIRLTNLDIPKVKNQNAFTSIESIYKRHTDIANEIYQKAYAYNNGGKLALLNLEKDGKHLFNSHLELEQMLLSNYPLSSDINKRPLSKFMQDLAKQAGLISS
jgi:5-methylcytosine-specific restriction endonuclease McrA